MNDELEFRKFKRLFWIAVWTISLVLSAVVCGLAALVVLTVW